MRPPFGGWGNNPNPPQPWGGQMFGPPQPFAMDPNMFPNPGMPFPAGPPFGGPPGPNWQNPPVPNWQGPPNNGTWGPGPDWGPWNNQPNWNEPQFPNGPGPFPPQPGPGPVPPHPNSAPFPPHPAPAPPPPAPVPVPPPPSQPEDIPPPPPPQQQYPGPQQAALGFGNPVPGPFSGTEKSGTEELSEEEKQFDEQFKDWEAKFNTWREENKNHPDKKSLQEYERQWNEWRQKLVEQREVLRQQRIARAALKPLVPAAPTNQYPNKADEQRQENQSQRFPEQSANQQSGPWPPQQQQHQFQGQSHPGQFQGHPAPQEQQQQFQGQNQGHPGPHYPFLGQGEGQDHSGPQQQFQGQNQGHPGSQHQFPGQGHGPTQFQGHPGGPGPGPQRFQGPPGPQQLQGQGQGFPGPRSQFQGPLGPQQRFQGPPGPHQPNQQPPGPHEPNLGPRGPHHQQNHGPPGPQYQNQGPPGPHQPNQGPPGPHQPSPGPPGPTHPNQGAPGPHQQNQGPPGLHQQNQGPPGSHQRPPGPHLQNQGLPGPHQQNQGPPGPQYQNQGPPGPHHPSHGPPGPHQQAQGPSGPHQQNQGPPGPHHPNQGPPGLHQQNQGPPGPNQQTQGPAGPQSQNQGLLAHLPPQGQFQQNSAVDPSLKKKKKKLMTPQELQAHRQMVAQQKEREAQNREVYLTMVAEAQVLIQQDPNADAMDIHQKIVSRYEGASRNAQKKLEIFIRTETGQLLEPESEPGKEGEPNGPRENQGPVKEPQNNVPKPLLETPVLQNRPPLTGSRPPVVENRASPLQNRPPLIPNRPLVPENRPTPVQNQPGPFQNTQSSRPPHEINRIPLILNRTPVTENRTPHLQNRAPLSLMDLDISQSPFGRRGPPLPDPVPGPGPGPVPLPRPERDLPPPATFSPLVFEYDHRPRLDLGMLWGMVSYDYSHGGGGRRRTDQPIKRQRSPNPFVDPPIKRQRSPSPLTDRPIRRQRSLSPFEEPRPPRPRPDQWQSFPLKREPPAWKPPEKKPIPQLFPSAAAVNKPSEPKKEPKEEPKPAPSPQATLMSSVIETVKVEDLVSVPGRYGRPSKIVVILRGLPGSGKSYFAKLLKEKELSVGGAAPRILSIDDYYLLDDGDDKQSTSKDRKSRWDPSTEESYRLSLVKSFRRHLDDGLFSFIVVDAMNLRTSHVIDFSAPARGRGYDVYLVEMEDKNLRDSWTRRCSPQDLDDLRKMWELAPISVTRIDPAGLLQDSDPVKDPAKSSPENVVTSTTETAIDEDSEQGFVTGPVASKWETIEQTEEKLDRLDGLRRKAEAEKPASLEDWLQLPDDYEDRKPENGKKRVRWADIEERREQDKMRKLGFIVGQTDWNRMMDPTNGQSALTKTKYI